MFGKSGNKKEPKIDTLIGQHTEFLGDLRFSGGLHIDGTVRGNIVADEDQEAVLSLSELGHVEGEIRVPNMVLNGSVTGDVYASEYVQLAANARINGNIHYKVIEIAQGASINGSLFHYEHERKSLLRIAAADAEDVAAVES